MTDPTPTPTAPDWRALCQELLQPLAEYDGANPYYEHRDLITRVRAALATPQAPPLEPRGCPLPGGCSCPTAPIVPPELIWALVWSEAALADIGDAEREPGDDLAWAERRAAEELPRIRRALQTWRHHPTQPAATREAGPLPQAPTLRALLHPAYEPGDGSADGAQLVDGEWWHPIMGCDSLQGVVDNARAVLARWGGAAVQPVAEPVNWDRRPPTASDCYFNPGATDGFLWVFYPEGGYDGGGWWGIDQWDPKYPRVPNSEGCTHWLPFWAIPLPAADAEDGWFPLWSLPVPAADKGEVQP